MFFRTSLAQFPLQTKAAQPLFSVSKFLRCITSLILAICRGCVGISTSKCWDSPLAWWGHSVMLWLWLWPGTEDYRSKLGGDCFADLACPEKCRCEGTTVDCSNQKLTKIPDHIPQYTAELWVPLVLPSIKCVRAPPCISSFSVSISQVDFSLCLWPPLLFSPLNSGVSTIMNSLCLRRPGSSKSCLSWGRCESDML